MNALNQRETAILPLLIGLALTCFALSLRLQAIVPPPNSLPPAGPMRFIEQLFGLAPDGGNGLMELVIIALPFLLISLAIRRLGAVGIMGDS
jgi:hypothetical protein